MKVLLILIIWAVACSNTHSQKINFKDKNFEIAILKQFDANHDGNISVVEIDTVTKLDISESNIEELDDIRYFRKIKILNAMTNHIKSLDVFNGNATIEKLFVGENDFGKKLSLKNVKNLKGLYAFRSGIEEIELLGLENLEELYLQGNLLSGLDVSNLPQLWSLQLDDNKNLQKIDVSHNTQLHQLYLSNTQITALDLSKNSLMKTLYVPKGINLIRPQVKKELNPMPSFEGRDIKLDSDK